MTAATPAMIAFEERLRAHALAMRSADHAAAARVLVYTARRHPRFEPDFAQVGGFADRIKGVVAAYLLAIAADAGFVVDWTRPCPLEPTLSIAACDWRPTSWRARLLGEKTTRHVDLIDALAYFEGAQPEEAMRVVFGEEALVHLNVNIYSHSFVSKLFPGVDPALAFKAAFDALFTYSPPREFTHLRAALAALRAEHDAVIGVHLRTGEGNGWNDPSMGNPEQAEALLERAAAAARSRGYTNPAFYFASDSLRAKTLAAAAAPRFGRVIAADHAIQHIDRSEGTDRDGFDFAVAEFMILAACDYIVGAAGNYWHTAALVGGRPHERFA